MADQESSSPAALELSLVIPAYNEAARLDAGFARLRTAIDQGAVNSGTTQFIVVDDGSSDGTAGRAAEVFDALPHVDVIRLPRNRGKGQAVRTGVAAATAPAIAFADADMAIDPVQIPKFLAALEHADLAIGSRAASGASVDRPSIRRSAMNRSFNLFVNAVTHLSLADTQCGFKAFRAPVARLLFHCSGIERMAFDVEILELAKRFGFSIAQVPVHWSRVEGSHVRSWSDSGSMVRDVLRASRSIGGALPLVGMRVPAAADSTAHDELGKLANRLPVLRLGGGEFLILFPLTAEDAAESAAKEIAAQLGFEGTDLERVTTPQLQALAPLPLHWGDPVSTASCT